MIQSKGKNQYLNHKFSFWEWSAPVLQTPEDLMAAIRELKLTGRVIRDMQAVGMGYNWREDGIADGVYTAMEQLSKAPPPPIAEAELFLPEGVSLSRWAEIDEPMLIAFQDGDILGIDFSEGSSVRMELNTIPWDIRHGTNPKTFHANRLFADMIGKEITAVDFSLTTEEPEFTGSFGLDLEEQPFYIGDLSIRYTGGILRFSPFYDYGNVELLDRYGKAQTISCPAVRDVVEGFLQEE